MFLSKTTFDPADFNCMNKLWDITQNNFVLKQIQYFREATDLKCTISELQK